MPRFPENFGPITTMADTDQLLVARAGNIYDITYSLFKAGIMSFVTVGTSGSGAMYVCDGVDDQVTILAAITSLGTGGGTVLLMPGTYVLSDTLVNPFPNVRIEGCGFGTEIKLKSSSGVPSGTCLIKTMSYNQLGNFKINGNKSTNTYGGGIHVYQSARSMFENLYIYDCAESGILSEGTSSSLSSHANKYSNISILDCGGYGMFAHTYSYDLELNNIWIGRCNVGYRVEDSDNGLTNLHVRGCTGNGVELRGDYNRLTNCYLETNGGKGLDLFGSDGNIVNGANIRGNLGRGINVSDSNKNSFSNCDIINNTGEGILISGTSADTCIQATCYDNQASKTQTYGIKSNNTTFRTLVTGSNSLTTNHVTAGVLLQGTGDKADTANNIIN